MRTIPYWLDTPYTPRSPLQETIHTDVVIIGGGITGVSAAYHCTKAGFKTVLIEQEAIASGSAGKNGGMVVEGTSLDFMEMIEKFGKEQAKELWQQTIDAREHVVSLIHDHNIECDLSRLGSLYIAKENSDITWLERELATRKDSDLKGELVTQQNPTGTSLYVSDDCIIHPVKFIRRLAECAEKMGLVIHEHTPAISFNDHEVVTPHGTITAQKVVVTIESWKPNLTEEQGSIHTNLGMVTEPLSPEEMNLLNWNTGGMMWNISKNFVSARKIGTRIFLNGDITNNPSDVDLNEAQENVLTNFLSYFPHVPREKIIISHRWTGLLLYLNGKLPVISNHNGYYELFGSGGNGLTNGIMLGELITKHFQGKEIPEIYQE